jgi:hypothetical protein
MNRRGHEYFLIVVDHFNKMCLLIPCKKIISGREATELFFNNVWVHFLFPTSIICDRDIRFLGRFWTMLWERMDTKLK